VYLNGQRVLADQPQVRQARPFEAGNDGAHEWPRALTRPVAADAGVRLNLDERCSFLRLQCFDGSDLHWLLSSTCCFVSNHHPSYRSPIRYFNLLDHLVPHLPIARDNVGVVDLIREIATLSTGYTTVGKHTLQFDDGCVADGLQC
jgi:hypothetical protein